MSRADHLGAYAVGWTNGDPAAILKGDFAAYFAELKETLDTIRGGTPQQTFIDLTEIVTNDEGGVLTAWCWWSFPGTDIQGSGLLKVSDDGVVSERITYYTALAG
jgi:hypothetical protein